MGNLYRQWAKIIDEKDLSAGDRSQNSFVEMLVTAKRGSFCTKVIL